jgi:hypothetical protein
MKSMMLKAASFAHLLGLPSKAAKAEDNDDDKKQRPDESDEDYANRMDEEDKKDKSSKKSKKADGGDDDDDDAEDDSDDAKAARQSERARCKAIFADASAGVRPDLAAHLAFNTNMSAPEAVSLLATAATGGTKGRNLADRMTTARVPNVGVDAEAPTGNSAATTAARIIAAGAKARGEK